MSDFKAKMHRNPISVGALPQTLLGELTSPPDPVAEFKGPTSKGRGWKRREWKEGRGPFYFFLRPCILLYADETMLLLPAWRAQQTLLTIYLLWCSFRINEAWCLYIQNYHLSSDQNYVSCSAFCTGWSERVLVNKCKCMGHFLSTLAMISLIEPTMFTACQNNSIRNFAKCSTWVKLCLF